MDVGELRVVITGDASGLDSAVTKGTRALTNYKKQMQEANTALLTSKNALTATQRVYEANRISVDKNIASLKNQRTEIDRNIALRQNEKRLLTEANKGLDKNSTAYKDNKKALEWINTELDTYAKQNDKINKSIRSQETMLAGSKKAYDDARLTVNAATQQYAQYEKGLKAVEQRAKALDLQESGQRIKDFGENFNDATKPLQYTALALAAGGIGAAKLAIDFEDSFASVKKTVDGTPEQLEAVRAGIIDLATTGIEGRNPIPITTSELNALAAAGGQLGIQTENIVEFTEVMAMLGTATNLSGEEGAAVLAQFMNVTNTAQGDISNLGSAIVALGNNFATNEAKIADMAMNIGATSTQMKISAQDTLAYATTLSSMGVEAQAGGSAMSRILMDIQSAVSGGGAALNQFAKISGKSSKEFATEWKQDASKAFKSFLDGLSKSEDIVKTLQDLNFNNIYDIQALQRLSSEKGLELLTNALQMSNDAWDENIALQKEFDDKAETTAAKLRVAKQNFTEVARSVGDVMLPTIADASEGLAEFAQGLASMSDGAKKTVVGAGSVVVAAGLTAKGIASTAKAIGTYKTAFGKLLEITGMTTTGALSKAFAIIPPQAKVATVAVVALGVAAKKTYDYFYDKRHNYSDGMQEQADAIGKATSKLEEYNDLSKEVKGLREILNTSDSTSEELEKAKSRLEEIAEILEKEYDLNINVDTEDVENTLKLLDTKTRGEIIDSSAGLIEKVVKGADSYQKDFSAIPVLETNKKTLKDEILLYDRLYQSAKVYKEAFDLDGDVTTYQSKMSKLYDEAQKVGLKIATDSPGDFTTVLEGKITATKTSLSGVENRLAEASGNVAEVKKATEDATNYLTQALQSDIMSDNAYGADSDVALLESLGKSMITAGMGVDELSRKMAAAKQGLTLDEVLEKGGEGLKNASVDYVKFSESIGLSTAAAVKGAGLFKNGISDMQSAIDSGALEAVEKDMNNIAKSMGKLPDNKHIELSADGDVSIIDKTTGFITDLSTKENINVTVNADGSIDILNQATGEAQNLTELGAVEVFVNADGNIEVLNAAEQSVATINGTTAEVTYTAKTSGKEDVEDLNKATDETKDKEINVNAEVDGKDDVDALKTSIDNLPESKTTYVTTKFSNIGVIPNAKGTKNFAGGLAMVNDEPGLADNRELIIDHGRAFIPEGRNVIMPVSKGATIYTASQTKAIMNGLGIPHYASGKNNSDAFTNAQSNWKHYTSTHAVTVTEELAKWVEFSEQFKDNQKDVWDIQEQIFSLMRKQTQEFNEQSKAYIAEHTALNDWVNDNPIDAFGRVKERNLKEFQEGKQTWEEYSDTVSNIGSQMYQDRVKQSRDWLDHEEKYNELSAEDYIKGLERVKEYTTEYYTQGIISYREYAESMQEINDSIEDKNKSVFDNWLNDANEWEKLRDGFGDWELFGDTKIDFIQRKINNVKQAFKDGMISQAEYTSYMNDFSLDMFKAQEEQLDKVYEAQREYIDRVSEQFAAEEQALRDSWTIADRDEDMAEIRSQMEIYKHSVTEAGKQKYEDLQNQLESLEREEELYQLEQEHKEILEDMEESFEKAEQMKKDLMFEMRNVGFDITDICDTISTSTSEYQGKIVNLITQAIQAIREVDVEVYNDNSIKTTNTTTTVELKKNGKPRLEIAHGYYG